jgi:hypothetical protein
MAIERIINEKKQQGKKETYDLACGGVGGTEVERRWVLDDSGVGI